MVNEREDSVVHEVRDTENSGIGFKSFSKQCFSQAASVYLENVHLEII